MWACQKCGSANPNDATSCVHCGARRLVSPNEQRQPTMLGGAGQPIAVAKTPSVDFDLDLPKPVPKTPSMPKEPVASAPVSGPSNAVPSTTGLATPLKAGTPMDDWDMEGAENIGLQLGTQTKKGPSVPHVGSNVGASKVSSSGAPGHLAAPLQVGSPMDDWDMEGAENIELQAVAPSATHVSKNTEKLLGKSGERRAAKSTVEIDPYEVKILADFGADPKALWQTPSYAVRVKKRQFALRKTLTQLRSQLAEAEARRDEHFAKAGEQLRPLVQNRPDFAEILQPLQSAESTKKAREQAQSTADESYQAHRGALDNEAKQLETQLNELRAVWQQHQAVADEAESLRAKHEARRKRVDIEVRNAQTVLQRADAPQAEKARAQQVIQAANLERQQRAAEEGIASQQAQTKAQEAAVHKKRVDDVEQKLSKITEQIRILDKEHSHQGAMRNEGIHAAGRDLQTALKTIGRIAFEQPDLRLLNDAQKRELETVQAQVTRLHREVEKHLRALGSADEKAVRNGLTILVGGAALLLLLFVLWRLLRSNPYTG